ncbi:MAG: GIY-YIG nuclease family protein [Eubacteriales bacterium]|jgi:hypothetical protein|nr:GIY-YIG nuclease family protein [Eubacteriales bacterium]
MKANINIAPVLHEYLKTQSEPLSKESIEGMAKTKEGYVFIDVFESPQNNQYFQYEKTHLPLQMVEYCTRGITKLRLIDVLEDFCSEYPDMEWKIEGEKRGFQNKQNAEPKKEPVYDQIIQNPLGQSYVYFLQGGDGGLIKIGKANDVEKRIGEIQRMSPIPLNILCTIKCKDAHRLESSLHTRFMKYRRHGEWFEPAKPIYDFIEGVKG